MLHILGEIYIYQVKSPTHLRQYVYERILQILSSVFSLKGENDIYLKLNDRQHYKGVDRANLISDSFIAPASKINYKLLLGIDIEYAGF